MPLIFEPPQALCASADRPEIWIVATGGENWGGCNVWFSSDGGVTYKEIGTILCGGNQGVLSQALASGSTPDTTNDLFVDLSISRGELESDTQDNADKGLTLCYVDGELIAYRDATLVDEHSYQLHYLVRGVCGTTIGAHASGSQFARLDGHVFKYVFPQTVTGSVAFKFCSFNLYNCATEALEDVTPVAYTITGVGVVPAGSILEKSPSTGSMVVGDTSYLEPAITPGDATQYWRGDKAWQTLNQAAVAGLTTTSNVMFASLITTATLQAQGNLNLRANWAIMNKAASGWVTVGTRNTSGSESVMDLANVGTITVDQYRLKALNSAPASASATGALGEIRVDANYIYVCVAANTWKRSALSTW